MRQVRSLGGWIEPLSGAQPPTMYQLVYGEPWVINERKPKRQAKPRRPQGPSNATRAAARKKRKKRKR